MTVLIFAAWLPVLAVGTVVDLLALALSVRWAARRLRRHP